MPTSGSLVERGDQRRVLGDAMVGGGSLVFLTGEAGFGKTSLLEVALSDLDHKHSILSATCEPLGIPAPFAPLFDLLDVLPDEVCLALRSGAGRPAIYTGVLDLLKNDRVVLVIEDAHWADEATLGLIRYLGRRIEATDSCLILSYRTEELALNPRLLLLIGDLGRRAIRVDLPALSLSGVEALADGLEVDATAVHAATLGNPFFVEEVLNHPQGKLPPSIENAVLASASILPPEARELLNLVALSPDGITAELAAQHIGHDSSIDQAVQRRLLDVTETHVRCRHALIQESLVHGVPAMARRALHRRLLDWQEANGGTAARLAFHSVGAGEAERAITYSIEAAEEASRRKAHRQAAFQYDNALRFGSHMTPAGLSRTLLAAAAENILVNRFDEARDLARRRVPLASNVHETASALAWVAHYEWRKNDFDAARKEAELAIPVLRQAPPGEELAVALAVLASVSLSREDAAASLSYANEALAVAAEVRSIPVEAYAKATLGYARWAQGDKAGLDIIESASRFGADAGIDDAAARAMNCLAWVPLLRLELEEARRRLSELIEYTTAREIDNWYVAAVITSAWIDVAAGRWHSADQRLEEVLGQKTCTSSEVEATRTAAWLRIRRGDPGAADLVQATRAAANAYGEYHEMVPTCALVMEGAWAGLVDEQLARNVYEEVLPQTAGDRRSRALLSFWAERLGWPSPDGDLAGPPSKERNGELEAAAEEWERLGFPIESAITRARCEDADLEQIFTELAGLGAEGVARGLRRELKRRGVKRVPRGERPATRTNVGGLTTRQVEVLELLAAGLSNSEIAERLFISERTAGHHVSALLAKLSLSSRLQAAAWASSHGLHRVPI